MPTTVYPDNEPTRLDALRDFDIAHAGREDVMDDLARIAGQICGTLLATVSIIDADTQYYKGVSGSLDLESTSRDIAICQHTILSHEVMVITDASRDERFSSNPFVTGPAHVRFYAGAPLVTSTGHALGTICVIDTMPRSLSEDQRLALEALSRQVVANFELRRATRELGHALREKNEFLRIASHDLKNPLTVVSLATYMLLTRADETNRPVVESIARQANTMKKLVEDYLDAQAIEDGQLKLDIKAGDINQVARDVASDLDDYAQSKSGSIVMDLGSDLPPILMDDARISQVAINMVSNALKFSPPGNDVIVRTLASPDTPATGPGAMVRLEVEDRGPGLSPEDMKSLFRRYARLSAKPTGGEKSTGLGLAICRRLVELHGGTVGARNNPPEDGGSTFWLDLPAAAV